MIFEMTSAAGAEMSDAAITCPASTPKLTYAASTDPATVAMPVVMSAINSEPVMVAR